MKQITVKKRCSEEGCYGEVKFNGTSFTSYPSQYGHFCDSCKKLSIHTNCFPYAYLKFEEYELETEWNNEN